MYNTGFGNEFATEAIEGALPRGQNSPQRVALGLYAEQFSGSPFTAPRHMQKRSWLYRIRPSVLHEPFVALRDAPEIPPTPPTQLRWDPLPIPAEPTDFVDGLTTIATNDGIGVQIYRANRAMTDRFFYDADGELLIVPELGAIALHTELGIIDAKPGEIAVIPRGTKFRVDIEGEARGY